MPAVLPAHAPLAPAADRPAPTAAADAPTRRLAFVSPRHRDDPDWRWVTEIGAMRRYCFTRVHVDNTFEAVPKLTRPHRWWQYARAEFRVRGAELVYLFSDDVAAPLSAFHARAIAPGKRVYVGFTQDGAWAPKRIDRFGRLLRRCDAVTMFTAEERDTYLSRYGLAPDRAHVIPLHTDETAGYDRYLDAPAPSGRPYVVSLGSPNRRFMRLARICSTLGIDLVVITRSTHRGDDLGAVASLGARVVTGADRFQALSWLRHARLGLFDFEDPTLPGGFTTIVHAMFLGTPFVATACLGLAEHVVDGETGLLVDPGDETSLARAIELAWEDRELRRRLTDAGRARARKRHSLEAAAEAFAGLTESLLAA